MPTSTRARLVDAAFALFEERGFTETTVDEIAARAGTGRTTFFRHFRGKDDVVFPDHDQLLPRVAARLSTATSTTRDVALREAARVVLDHYLDEGETARARYRLTRTVPALRDRESASAQRYLRLFRDHITAWTADEADGALRAELLAAAVITAHNHVLRGWLREETENVDSAFEAALTRALATAGPAPSTSSTVVVHTTASDVEQVLREVRGALTDWVRP
ncbi:TetR family transcriptional regulator [Nocardioides jensenii]|uniref:TetR family transcriptional regulator n=1 Tax=Nocardioides jensenii TaxID=1843 RepID=UPI0008361054|nr:TetR family transcriptional regulator [Nocardioides jensenii]